MEREIDLVTKYSCHQASSVGHFTLQQRKVDLSSFDLGLRSEVEIDLWLKLTNDEITLEECLIIDETERGGTKRVFG